jgi:hypothetical protein
VAVEARMLDMVYGASTTRHSSEVFVDSFALAH